MSIYQNKGAGFVHFSEEDETVDGVHSLSKNEQALSKNPEWLPTWNLTEKYPKILPFKHIDRALFGDLEYENLFKAADGEINYREITPKFGTEVKSGIQLSKLDDKAKDDLALLVAKRGVVVLRNQDLKEKGPAFVKEWGEYFGPLHIHPTSGAPAGFPEFHIVYRKAGDNAKENVNKVFAYRTQNIIWHSDATYELQPPGITALIGIKTPESGGDTIFADTVEAYERLSPQFQKMLDGLKVAHTSKELAKNTVAEGGIERRAAVDNIHPLVRWHPVLKKKILFLQRGFGKRILGLKVEESDAVLNFLFNHVESAHDLQLRANWEEGTVVLWDNRRVVHSGTFDWNSEVSRHCVRVTPQAERPVASEEEYLNWDPEAELKIQEHIDEIIATPPAEVYELLKSLKI
ncbi:dioxygenase activity protein [[Candida] boidinii]|nr:dioxygenase activity protein [[Candida] boidinii]OWB62746.1 dioxygenase activity protein [[Candida] boidinii]OWB72713.1 dioxygenase activity protein [[Candida] boidinii]OWB80446.1 dioxygenase activity protein [[Candida] boidinii]